jgi:ribosomal protein L40E
MTVMSCPSCGATNPEQAEWCGQCFARFGAPEPGKKAPAPPSKEGTRQSGGDGGMAPPARPPDLRRTVPVRLVPTAEGRIRKVGAKVQWTCVSCETVNPIDEPACRVCSGSMLNLFREPGPPAEPRDRNRALALSIIPGAGLWYAGNPADGVSRLLLWVWWVATTVMLWGRPPALLWAITLPFALATVTLWGVSALDAVRLAEGRKVLAGARVLGVTAAVLSLLLLLGLFTAAMAVTPDPPPAAPVEAP